MSSQSPEQALAPLNPGNIQKSLPAWQNIDRDVTTQICLPGDKLLAFTMDSPYKAQRLVDRIEKGDLRLQELLDGREQFQLSKVTCFSLDQIISVTPSVYSLHFTWLDLSGKRKKVSLACRKPDQTPILQAIQQRLGPHYQIITRPISRLSVLGSSLLLILIDVALTAFFYWEALGLATVQNMRVGMRERGMAFVILLIGPNGFLLLGGLVLALLLYVTFISLKEPPLETVLLRSSSALAGH